MQPSLGDLLHSFPGAVPGLRAQPPGAAQGSAGTVALVFGREESGLTEDEMRLMSHLCAIPSGRVHPSLNLSHAVTVVLAEVRYAACQDLTWNWQGTLLLHAALHSATWPDDLIPCAC